MLDTDHNFRDYCSTTFENGGILTKNASADAKAIFDYLRELLELKNRPITSLAKYSGSDTWVLALDNMVGLNLGVRCWTSIGYQPAARATISQGKREIFVVPKISALEPPTPPDLLQRWLSTDIDDANIEPTIYSVEEMKYSDDVNIDDLDFDKEQLDYEKQFSVVESELLDYLPKWKQWSTNSGEARQVRKSYNQLFDAMQKLKNQPESWQLILGLGYLRLGSKLQTTIDRHLFTVECQIELNASDGEILLSIGEDTEFNFEDDWIDNFPKPDRTSLIEIQDALEREPFLDPEATKKLFIELSNKYSSKIKSDSHQEIKRDEDALTLSPTLIFRKKSADERAEFIRQLNEIIQETDDLSAPLMALIDPAYQSTQTNSDWSDDGGVVKSQDQIYFPLRLNQKQLHALKMADTQFATVIQGPPGTGKTRTIAAMVSHFLAKGERVLVTAQTGQALKEVRKQLPENIRNLAVSNLGAKKSDNDDVQKSVNELISADENRMELVNNYSAYESRILSKIDEFKSAKARVVRAIIDIRGNETRELNIAGFIGSPASLLAIFFDKRESIKWLEDLLADQILPTLTPEEFLKIENLKRSILSTSTNIEIEPSLPDQALLWDPKKIQDFYNLGNADSESETTVRGLEAKELRASLDNALQLREQILANGFTWVRDLETNIRKVNSVEIASEIEEVRTKIQILDDLILDMDNPSDIDAKTTHENWLQLLDSLKGYIAKGGPLKTSVTGEIKYPLIGGQVLKANKTILDSVRISGLRIRTGPDVERMIALVKFDSEISKFWHKYFEGLDITDRTLIIRRHNSQKVIISHIKNYMNAITEVRKIAKRAGIDTEITKMGILDLDILDELLIQLDFKAQKATLQKNLDSLIATLRLYEAKHSGTFLTYLHSLTTGEPLDQETFDNVVHIVQAQNALNEYVAMITKISSQHPVLQDWLLSLVRTNSSENSSANHDNFQELPEALNYCKLGRELIGGDGTNYSDYFDKAAFCDDQIEVQVQELAYRRAWKKALERITPQTLSDMKRYAHANKSLGKGTGKTAARRKQEIRALLKECSTAVPVWIMPIDRIAQQFVPSMGLFDVVIIDEASQAGLDGLFLLGIGKKIVVVGDDKQVSPDAIGIKADSVEKIYNNHFSVSKERRNWSNPDVSMFDECKMAFGNLITLTEHRRCVPEIIEFSNMIAYVPEGIRLVPVRQTGSSSLPPIKTHFVPNGYLSGSGSTITNIPEADAIARKVAEMVSDPVYKDASIGVISLQGTRQHEIIQQRILELISPEEFAKHDLRVDRPPAFQGSERNVILLSMVMTPGKGTAQTRMSQVQRYNVAMSRARDQVILFHSMRDSDLRNSEDLRKRLLTYCLEVEKKISEPIARSFPVPEDVRVDPFDSLFEQRVYSRIVERGYLVQPQHKPEIDGHDYRIDLVVIGPFGKLAIECDGEEWHGEDEYAQDLIRQDELVRAGWQIYRIRESDFYGDPHALEPLWNHLEVLVTTDAGKLPPIFVKKFKEKEVLGFNKLPEIKTVENSETPANSDSTYPEINRAAAITEIMPVKSDIKVSKTWLPEPGRQLHDPSQASGFAAELLEIVLYEGSITTKELIFKHKSALGNPDITDAPYKKALLQLFSDNQIIIQEGGASLLEKRITPFTR
jgi:superfamily I DNA and/or RNA helicase/very-short-patch-repair endonuclease